MNAPKPTQNSSLTQKDGISYDVPVEGSLGLLALGYQGLVAWRAKRKETAYNFSEHLLLPKPTKKDNA